MSDTQTLPTVRISDRAKKELGFDDVLRAIAGLCRAPYGKEAVTDDVFADDAAVIGARLSAAIEAKHAARRLVAPDFGGLKEVRHIVEASGKGTVLAAADIVDVAKTIDALSRLKDVIEAQGDDAPTLTALADRLADERRFARRVLRSFDDTLMLVDDASPELSVRRSRVRALRQEAQEKLMELVREHDETGLLRDRNFTLRNDRYVLPVKSEYQGKVDGIVHDASQTHQTVFIEPRALMALGNRLTIARADVTEEEQRILRELSEEISELAPRLADDLKLAGAIEAAFARGVFAAATDGEAVNVDVRGAVVLVSARHPLLAWQRYEAKKRGESAAPVTPNDLRLDGARCLVVSGPNAGGKTVALKTIGLIALMARAGLPVPVGHGSQTPAFSGVCVAIGDEQSLSDGASSFSGHLRTVRAISDEVERDVERGPVLVLLDELMSGTDPAQGAALAQAFLEELTGAGDGRVSVVVTTHYDRLKALALAEAEGTEGNRSSDARRFRNASVQTDGQGRPTFVLRLDEVGTSNALDAARREGLKDATVERALALLAPEQKELHALLRALAEQRQVLAARVDEATASEARLRDESRRLEQKLLEVDAERARLRREGKRAFLDELKEARQVVKDAIAQSQSKDAKVVNAAAQTLKKLEDETRAAVAERTELSSSSLAPTRVQRGDTVELATMPGVRLTVEEVSGDDVTVARGAVRTRTTLSALRLPQADDAKPEPKTESRKRPGVRSTSREGAPEPASDPKTSDTTLDLRGQRADDALEQLEAFLDKLLRDGRRTGHVLHGHGGGSLKKAVRQYLSRSRYVSRHAPGGLEDGGDAWTVIDLNPDAKA